MGTRILLLRIAYWAGAVFDAVMIVPMLFPPIGGMMFGIPHFQPGAEYQYAMGIGASLMAGWTLLLLWADRKPIERRSVLIITTLPVVAGMIASNLFGISNGLFSLTKIWPIFLLQGFLAILFLSAYRYSSQHPQNK